jgi:hypothetical protein
MTTHRTPFDIVFEYGFLLFLKGDIEPTAIQVMKEQLGGIHVHGTNLTKAEDSSCCGSIEFPSMKRTTNLRTEFLKNGYLAIRSLFGRICDFPAYSIQVICFQIEGLSQLPGLASLQG